MYLTIGLNVTQTSNAKLREFAELIERTLCDYPDVHPVETGNYTELMRKAATLTNCEELKKLCDAIEYNEMKLYFPGSTSKIAIECVSYVVPDLDLQSMRTAVKQTEMWKDWFDINMPTSKIGDELLLFPIVEDDC